jgi:hypothetical protein
MFIVAGIGAADGLWISTADGLRVPTKDVTNAGTDVLLLLSRDALSGIDPIIRQRSASG